MIRPGSTSKLRSSTATKDPKRLVSPRISILAPVAVVVVMGYLVMSCPDPCRLTWREGQPPGGTGSLPRGTATAGNAAGSTYDGPIMTEWLLLLLGVVLTVGTALFVAAEFSLVALDRPTVQRAVDAGEPGARSVLTSHRRLSTQLSACQLGITLTTLVLGFIASPSIGALLAGPAAVAGVVGVGRVVDRIGARDADRHRLLDDRRRDGAQDARRLAAPRDGEGRGRAGARGSASR